MRITSNRIYAEKSFADFFIKHKIYKKTDPYILKKHSRAIKQNKSNSTLIVLHFNSKRRILFVFSRNMLYLNTYRVALYPKITRLVLYKTKILQYTKRVISIKIKINLTLQRKNQMLWTFV